MPSDKLINALAAEVLTAELEPLGRFLDAFEQRKLQTKPEHGAEQYRNIAKRARSLIQSGIDLPKLRHECVKSPALHVLLEIALHERASQRGRLAATIDYSKYAR